eukprot:1947652-Rhodomonas_salina.1
MSYARRSAYELRVGLGISHAQKHLPTNREPPSQPAAPALALSHAFSPLSRARPWSTCLSCRALRTCGHTLCCSRTAAPPPARSSRSCASALAGS